MPGALYHAGARGLCPHAGTVSTVSTNKRVFVGGQAVATAGDVTTVAGCPFQVPVLKAQPCVTVTWLAPAKRVFVNGQAALLKTSAGLCKSAEQIVQGPPSITVNQARVVGS